jgi:hypothetical protein
MPLHQLTDDERRSHCRREIEALEHWLRRLVHETFSGVYGPGYLDAVGGDGNRLFRNETVAATKNRRSEDPARYPRPIDAATLDDLVRVICKPENYDRHFREALGIAFPEGAREARTFLGRIVTIRNNLSHANPITVHEAARAICYPQDVIASLKEYYTAMSQQREYDVPMIIRVADSLGNVRQGSELLMPPTVAVVCRFYTGTSGQLHPGDRLSIEVEIDPTFERSSYRVRWAWREGNKWALVDDANHVTIQIDNSHVQEVFGVTCSVISNRDWHRYGDHDHRVLLCYKVLPPPS